MSSADVVGRYEQLLQYLDSGWEIEPPVLLRPTWHTRAEAKETYHFVLKREDQRWLMTVPVSSAAARFIVEQDLSVSAL